MWAGVESGGGHIRERAIPACASELLAGRCLDDTSAVHSSVCGETPGRSSDMDSIPALARVPSGAPSANLFSEPSSTHQNWRPSQSAKSSIR